MVRISICRSCIPAAVPMAAFHGDLRLSSVSARRIEPDCEIERTLKLSAVLGESRDSWTHIDVFVVLKDDDLVVVCDDMNR